MCGFRDSSGTRVAMGCVVLGIIVKLEWLGGVWF